LFVGLAAGHATTRTTSTDQAIGRLHALGVGLHRSSRIGEGGGKSVAIELPCTLPQRRIEGGVKSLASLDESVRGTFAPAREVKGVVAPVPGTGVKAYSAQLFGRLRVFLAAIGTNHDDARGRLHFSDAIVAHRYSFRMAPPRIHRAANREHSTKREKPASGPDGLSRPIFRILVSRFRSSLAARS